MVIFIDDVDRPNKKEVLEVSRLSGLSKFLKYFFWLRLTKSFDRKHNEALVGNTENFIENYFSCVLSWFGTENNELTIKEGAVVFRSFFYIADDIMQALPFPTFFSDATLLFLQ